MDRHHTAGLAFTLTDQGQRRQGALADRPQSALRKLAFSLLTVVQRSPFIPGRIRAKLLRLAGYDVSSETFVSQGVFFSGRRLKTEGMVSINAGAHINADAEITIGAGTRIACRVMLITSTHKVGGPDQRAGQTVWSPIRIGRGCWIGAGATVLPGVSVAPGCVIAAGAVVAADTRADGLYAGVPARRIKDLSA